MTSVLSMRLRFALVATSMAAVASFITLPAHAEPTQIIVFLGSSQKISENTDIPKVSLFGYYYARSGVSLLGIYAGPRWVFGPFGIELKVGAYGGTDLDTRAIVNNQMDLTFTHFSVTSFTDFYPTNEVYSYLSAFANVGPIFAGGVSDFTHDYTATPATVVTGGPTVGVGTKAMYLGTTYLFTNEHKTYIRLTVGLTF